MEKMDQQSKVLYSFFLLHVQIKNYRNVLKLSCRPHTLATHKAFSKIRRGLELVPLTHFLHDF